MDEALEEYRKKTGGMVGTESRFEDPFQGVLGDLFPRGHLPVRLFREPFVSPMHLITR